MQREQGVSLLNRAQLPLLGPLQLSRVSDLGGSEMESSVAGMAVLIPRERELLPTLLPIFLIVAEEHSVREPNTGPCP